MKQKTINNEITFEGKGLHTGLHLSLKLLPAEVNTGIRICRVDLESKPTYPALAQYVSATERGTVLENGEWKISTVEHLLSALYALGVTNCLVEVNGPEIPILDGSAKLYVERIQEVGVCEQEADAKVWMVKEPMTYTAQNGSTYRIEPADEEQVEVEISFPGNILHDQKAELLHLGDYASEVASARTFCFVREIAFLLGKGLIKGGDLQNALVIYEQPIPQEVMNSLTDLLGQPRQDASKLGYLSDLKYANEPARHKLLDVIGDFSLIGVRLHGKITAVRPGHGANTECAKWLMESLNVKSLK